MHSVLSDRTVPEMGMFPHAVGAYVATKLTCADAMPTVKQVEMAMEE